MEQRPQKISNRASLSHLLDLVYEGLDLSLIEVLTLGIEQNPVSGLDSPSVRGNSNDYMYQIVSLI